MEGQRWSGHCEGAAKMLKARSCTKPRDDFESQLLLSLRACVVCFEFSKLFSSYKHAYYS